jgi:hypothetical protein
VSEVGIPTNVNLVFLVEVPINDEYGFQVEVFFFNLLELL